MTLEHQLADADLARRLDREIGSTIKHMMDAMRGDVAALVDKMPEEYRDMADYALSHGFADADNALSDAIGTIRDEIPSDESIRDDHLDAIAEARHEQRAAE